MIKKRVELFESPKKYWPQLMFQMLIEAGAFANMSEEEKEGYRRIRDSLS